MRVALRDYWLILRRRWWLLLLVALAFAAGSFLYTRLQTPLYRTDVRLLVQPARPDLSLAETTSRLLRQYSLLLQTDEMARTVNQRLQLDLKPGELQSKVITAAVLEDFAISFQVTDTDPQRARDIAAVLADEFQQNEAIRMASQDPRERVDVTLMNQPALGRQVSPNVRSTVAAATLFGLLLGLLLVVAIELLDDTLKSSQDVRRWTGLRTLATLPRRRGGTQ